MTATKDKSRQQEFFSILEEFFERATGKSPNDFATFDSFGEEIRGNATALSKKGPEAFRFAWEALPQFYKRERSAAFEEARQAAGLKFVLGGSSRFGKTHFDSVRKMLLYADTILIPDPVLAWMEAPRDDERFQHVLHIEAAFSLLHLKPIINAELPYPAVIVFPSSNEHQNEIAAYSDSQLVFQGIVERLIPQFHLLENAQEMGANPMLCIPGQWHYYTTCATAFEERLQKQGLLEAKTVANMRAINQPNLSWLGNIPMNDLVRLRAENQNEALRKKIGDLTNSLNESSLQDLNKVTNEVSKEISSLLCDHSKSIRDQAAESQTKYKIIALGACATLAAVVWPFLAPFGIPVSAAAVAGGYAKTKIEELSKKKQSARSLLGILAAAKADNPENS